MTACPECRFVHTSTDTMTVGRFNPDGPRGYRARSGGPLRETRAEAERDECRTRQRGEVTA